MYSVGLYMLVYVHLYVYGDHILLPSAFLITPTLLLRQDLSLNLEFTNSDSSEPDSVFQGSSCLHFSRMGNIGMCYCTSISYGY